MFPAKTYHGKPCRFKGHTLRYSANDLCVVCVRASSNKRYHTHPEYWENWIKNNPDKVLARSRKFSAANRESERARHRAYHKLHPEKSAARMRTWRKRHPEKVEERCAKRRAVKRGVAVGCRKTYRAFVKSIRSAESLPCYWCGVNTVRKHRHLDHYIPIAKAGADSVENLVVSCPSCNHRKKDKLPEEFMARPA